ncbi:DUF4145 domain-containing protein [Alcaligenes nematophilus]|uniref:DUF4145 domain-containing protein n=1 Tax=Alcaligenes nematophilus TaxID=2994643 RepID=A0ABU3MW39_9BURK|nr:DUF4145 domain-containing protein [Alcaligenes nematophilus]MDT8470669.1 DUF4145 domain-containing protein [Alcaligenes nematophilus]MDT8505198.1 DUF4145 domain-containing protein [Alcaligenes nematophilus]MDT8527044.1 DUF4145 domain-containing protein [Alcaligenes nematophilus]
MAGNAIYKGTCPHCGTHDIAFTSVAQVQTAGSDDESMWNVFFVCNRCLGGLVVSIVSSRWFGPAGLTEDVPVPGSGRSRDGAIANFDVIDSYPNPPTHLAPDSVPERIAAAYIEASENLHRQKHETSQMLSRKALDLATKRLLPDSKKKLYGRIEELRDTGKITSEMADWAHIVRDEGNDSVHDEAEVTREEAAELLAFTETFLMYAFTLPGMIAKRRQVDDESEQTAIEN